MRTVIVELLSQTTFGDIKKEATHSPKTLRHSQYFLP